MKNIFMLILLYIVQRQNCEKFNKEYISLVAKDQVSKENQGIQKLQKSEFYSDKILVKQMKKMQELLKLRDTFIEQEGDLKFNENINLTTEFNKQKSLDGISYLGAQQKNDNLNIGINKPRNLDDDTQLYNRYELREIKPIQMECALAMKNYGIQYINHSQAAVLKVQFRSNCFKHTSQIMLIVQNVQKFPPSQVILQYKGIRNDGVFQVHNTQYKITPDILPKTSKQQQRGLEQIKQDKDINKEDIDRKLVKESRVKQYQQKTQDRNLMKTSGVQYDILSGNGTNFFFQQPAIKKLWDGSPVVECDYNKDDKTFAYYIMTCNI